MTAIFMILIVTLLKSKGFCLWPQPTCTWNLKFQSKLDLHSGDHVVYRRMDEFSCYNCAINCYFFPVSLFSSHFFPVAFFLFLFFLLLSFLQLIVIYTLLCVWKWLSIKNISITLVASRDHDPISQVSREDHNGLYHHTMDKKLQWI